MALAVLQHLQRSTDAVKPLFCSAIHGKRRRTTNFSRHHEQQRQANTLIDGDVVLSESVAIVLYLAEKYPDRGFIPADVKLRADLYRWILFAVTELEQPWWRIAKHTHLYPEQDRLPAEVALARRDFLPMAAVLEKHMRGRNYVTGDRVTAADFVVAYTLDVADEMQLLGECPTLRSYLERMYARPRAPQRIAHIFRVMRSGEEQRRHPAAHARSDRPRIST
jgi:glutathione S-transferase